MQRAVDRRIDHVGRDLASKRLVAVSSQLALPEVSNLEVAAALAIITGDDVLRLQIQMPV